MGHLVTADHLQEVHLVTADHLQEVDEASMQRSNWTTAARQGRRPRMCEGGRDSTPRENAAIHTDHRAAAHPDDMQQ